MVLFMARPTKRSGTSKGQFRKRVPADVLRVARGKSIAFSLPKSHAGDERIIVSAKIGNEVVFSLRTEDPSLITLRHGVALQQFERACAAYREGPRGLTQRQCVALAGILYRDLNASFEDEPIDANWWRIVAEVAERVLTPPPGPSLMIEAYPGEAQIVGLEKFVGPWVDPILSREGVIVAVEDRPKLLHAFARALIKTANKLKRNAEGDYSPDPAASHFPPWEGVAAKPSSRSSSLTFDSLLARWEKEDQKAASSLVSFRQHVAAFKAHLKHNDPRRVTKADVIEWKDALQAKGLSATTINGSYLASIRTLYRFAMRNDLIATDPTEGVKVLAKRKAGQGRLPYTDEEVAAILALADTETKPALRWIPWLLALTGARVGEIAQLWGSRVTTINGIAVIRIAPAEDGGTIKNAGSERDVPLHPAIIERGFLAFAESRPEGGPLFYGDTRAKPRPRKSETAGHASDGAINRVREWIREQGFKDKRKAPNHAFRHWFKSKCADLDIQDSVADAIQGHTDQSAAAGYRKISLAKMAEAIRKIPVPTTQSLGDDDTSEGGQS
jgi:integrase